MISLTERRIKKQQQKADEQTISREDYIKFAFDALAKEFRKHHNDNEKLNKRITLFVSSLSEQEMISSFLKYFDEYIEFAKKANVYQYENSASLSSELSNMEPFFDPLVDMSMNIINIGRNEFLETKAKIIMLRDWLYKEDAKYIARSIEKKYGRDKVPTFLYSSYGYIHNNQPTEVEEMSAEALSELDVANDRLFEEMDAFADSVEEASKAEDAAMEIERE